MIGMSAEAESYLIDLLADAVKEQAERDALQWVEIIAQNGACTINTLCVPAAKGLWDSGLYALAYDLEWLNWMDDEYWEKADEILYEHGYVIVDDEGDGCVFHIMPNWQEEG